MAWHGIEELRTAVSRLRWLARLPFRERIDGVSRRVPRTPLREGGAWHPTPHITTTTTTMDLELSECRWGSASSYLVYKRLVVKIRTANGEVDDVHFGMDSVIESIQEPRSVRHLFRGENLENVQVGVWCKPFAAFIVRRHHPGL